MKRYIYKPTGAEVTAPDGNKMPPELFEEISDKPKPRAKRTPKAKEQPVKE